MESNGIFGIQDLTKQYSEGCGKTQAISRETVYGYPGSGIGQNLSMGRARDYFACMLIIRQTIRLSDKC